MDDEKPHPLEAKVRLQELSASGDKPDDVLPIKQPYTPCSQSNRPINREATLHWPTIAINLARNEVASVGDDMQWGGGGGFTSRKTTGRVLTRRFSGNVPPAFRLAPRASQLRSAASPPDRTPDSPLCRHPPGLHPHSVR